MAGTEHICIYYACVSCAAFSLGLVGHLESCYHHTMWNVRSGRLMSL